MSWHTKSIAETIAGLNSDGQAGLSQTEAAERLKKHGQNKLREKPPTPLIVKFFAQLNDFMVIILLIAAAISFVTAVVEHTRSGGGDWLEPIAIVCIVVLNAIIGVIQESKAEAALAALRKMSAPTADVIRGGEHMTIDAADVVPGDVALLEAGDFVPADGRIIENHSLQVDESSLTGESHPVQKDASVLLDQGATLGDRINMVYSGCAVTYGRAVMLVTGTGMDTEMGHIAGLLENEEDGDTPLQKNLANLGKILGVACLVICAAIFVFGLFEQKEFMEMFMTAVALAVAAIPEGLPAIVTIVLAMGVRKMVARNAIVRRLPAVETLGCASVICSDKTGTLTQNRMTLIKLWALGGEEKEAYGHKWDEATTKLAEYATLCCDGAVEPNEDGMMVHDGDPTETAIVAAYQNQVGRKEALMHKYPRVGEIPFDSDRKLMTTVHEIGGKLIAITKGAPDVLLQRCVNADGGNIDEVNDRFCGDALRVLAVAYRELTPPVASDIPLGEGDKSASLTEGGVSEADGGSISLIPEEIEQNLTFLGLVGMIDPPRDEVKLAIKECAGAGIRTVMITGDHVVTACAIARQLGILREGDLAVSGNELTAMSDDELGKNIRKYSVYARVTPADKIRIVKAWQQAGEIVAMTGDGVNDAPALKAADIGCAMGITGTSVAKGAADVVLTDDNFATIVKAVKQGRGIYDNIKKSVNYLISCNIGEILCVFFAMLLWHETPLTAIHLLLINLITDALPALALGVEPVESDVMGRKPRSANESVFAGGAGVVVGFYGIIIGGIILFAYYLGRSMGGAECGQAMAFGVMALSELFRALSIRSRHSLFKVGLLSNKFMLVAIAVSGALSVLCMTVFGGVFGLEALAMNQWLWVAGLSLVPLVLGELVKPLGIRS